MSSLTSSPEARLVQRAESLIWTQTFWGLALSSNRCLALDACRELVGNKDAPIAGETLEKLHKRLIRNEDD